MSTLEFMEFMSMQEKPNSLVILNVRSRSYRFSKNYFSPSLQSLNSFKEMRICISKSEIERKVRRMYLLLMLLWKRETLFQVLLLKVFIKYSNNAKIVQGFLEV